MNISAAQFMYMILLYTTVSHFPHLTHNPIYNLHIYPVWMQSVVAVLEIRLSESGVSQVYLTYTH